MVAFQGSESSTSDGIIKVFEQAKKYNESNNGKGSKRLLRGFEQDVIPVVLLDEVGLAEISKYMTHPYYSLQSKIIFVQ